VPSGGAELPETAVVSNDTLVTSSPRCSFAFDFVSEGFIEDDDDNGHDDDEKVGSAAAAHVAVGELRESISSDFHPLAASAEPGGK
jgi:hypothetical protein